MPGAAIRFHPAAAREFWAALRWYQTCSTQAAQKFRSEFKRTAKRISAALEQGMLYRKAQRWMRVRRFPFLVYYQIIDATQVVILAFAHARRRPGYWRRRTPP
jgi:plasmid stabilization system protein ParE